MRIKYLIFMALFFLLPVRVEAGVRFDVFFLSAFGGVCNDFGRTAGTAKSANTTNTTKTAGIICSYGFNSGNYIGSDNSYIKSRSGSFKAGFRATVRDRYGNLRIYKQEFPDETLNENEGIVNDIAYHLQILWGGGLGWVNIPTDIDTEDFLVIKICFAVFDGNEARSEFGGMNCVENDGPGPGPEPGSCDLGGPYYLSHGSMDVYDVNGNEARVNINVTCSEDATLTFTAPNELDLGQNIVSQITLDGQQPDGLQLDFTAPGRPLVFASKLQTIGTPEAGTFDKVYLLQATIQ